MSFPTVVLSAVTSEYGLPYLDQLRVHVHNLNCVCRYRSNLAQGSSVLPEALRGEIETASCVIHLAGPRFGSGPLDVERAGLERTPAGEFWKPSCRTWLQPLLQAAGLQEAKGQTAAARAGHEELLKLDPQSRQSPC